MCQITGLLFRLIIPLFSLKAIFSAVNAAEVSWKVEIRLEIRVRDGMGVGGALICTLMSV